MIIGGDKRDIVMASERIVLKGDPKQLLDPQDLGLAFS